jgi:eukaryotic-like serine/threonine-protein kinase
LHPPARRDLIHNDREMSPIDCPSCGHATTPGAAFCGECGARLTDVPRCPDCGTPHRAGQKFCETCGGPLTPEKAQVSPPHAAAASPWPQHATPATLGEGRFRIGRLLGEGGRKRVFLARDEQLDREIALALIRTQGLDKDERERVRREARALAQLGDHPHIVTVFDIGQEGEELYIVSQYMAGGDLHALLRTMEDRRLPIDQALRVADQVCEALAHIHAHGFIHRDVKPGNIWFSATGTAKLGDFGLAITLDQSRLTQTGKVVGTVTHLAPEQALGTGLDARSDLYALGVTLYEMVTGRTPFTGDAVSVITQHIESTPVAPRWHNPEVPSALDALILRLLAKVPAERPDTAVAVRAALAAIASPALGPSAGGEMESLLTNDPTDRHVFVGRERELDELRRSLDDARSGRGRTVMVLGEAGIGKTCLAEKFATYASLRGAQILWGRCDVAEAAPALWVWTQIIREYVQSRDPEDIATDMGPGAADIAAFVSEVRDLVPGLPEPQPLDPQQARFRLFDSVASFLRNAAARQPIVLVLDDLHDGDESSLSLLEFLAREVRVSRLLIVTACREESLPSGLAGLAADSASSQILLRGLSESEVARYLAISAGHETPDWLARTVFTQTAGHPFYVTELVRMLVAERRLDDPGLEEDWVLAIPRGIREMIDRRLDHLSENANRVLRVASAVGRDFDLATLERVAGFPDRELLDALDEARIGGLIDEIANAGGRYNFCHGLVQETLRASLPIVERVQLHRRIAEALERLHRARPEPHLAQLAYHSFEALPGGDAAKAVNYACSAAERATRMLAYEQAAKHYGRALEALRRIESSDDARRCELTLALADAQARAGRGAAARDSYLAGADLARMSGLGDALARATLGFATLAGGRVPFGKVDPVLVGLLAEAVGVLGEDDSQLRAKVMARLAQAQYWSDSCDRRESLSDRAVAMARRLDDPATLAYVTHARRIALWDCESLEDRLLAGKEIVGLAERVDDPELMLQGRLDRVVDLLELGDVGAADAEIVAHGRLAHERREPLALWYAMLWRAMRALLEGRFDDAQVFSDRALAMGARIRGRAAEYHHWTQTFWIQYERGRLDEIPPENWSRFHVALPTWRMALAFAYGELGQKDDARRELDQGTEVDLARDRKDLNWLVTAALLSEVYARLRDHDRAARLYEVLRPYAARCLVVGRGVVCLGSMAQKLGLLCTISSRWDEAEKHFQAALELESRIGARPSIAHTQYRYAQLLLTRAGANDREKAGELLTTAARIATELGMKRLLEDVADLQAQPHDVSRR